MAHLCEHLLCQGSWDERTDLQEEVVIAGGTTNGWVFPDRISFGENLPPGAVNLGLEVAARRLEAPATGPSPARLQRERDVLLQERRERAAVPMVVEVEALHRLVFPPGHPYRRPPGGVAEEIARLTPDDVHAYASAHLCPERAVLAVVGDVDPEALSRRVEDLLGRLAPAGPAPTEPDWPDEQASASATLVGRMPYSRAYLAVRTAGFASAESLAAAVFARAMAAGRTSPLHRMLVERGRLAEVVRAYVEEYRFATVTAFVATAPPTVEAGRLAATLARAVDRLLAGELNLADLERGRKTLRIERLASLARPSLRADRLACNELFTGDAGPLDVDDRGLRDLDLGAVLDWARRAWSPTRRSVLAVEPEDRR